MCASPRNSLGSLDRFSSERVGSGDKTKVFYQQVTTVRIYMYAQERSRISALVRLYFERRGTALTVLSKH